MIKRLYNYLIEYNKYPVEFIYFDFIRLLLVTNKLKYKYITYIIYDYIKYNISKAFKTKNKAFNFFLLSK